MGLLPGAGLPGGADQQQSGLVARPGHRGIRAVPTDGGGAIILGNQAKAEISHTREQGGTMATAGIILGWIMCGLLAVGVVIILFGLLATAGSSELSIGD